MNKARSDRTVKLAWPRRAFLFLVALCAMPPEAAGQVVQYPRVVFFEERFESGSLGPFVEVQCPNEPLLPYPAQAGPCGSPGPTFWHTEAACNACVTPAGPLPPSFGSFAAAYNRMDEVPPVCTYETPGVPNAAAIETGSMYWPSWPSVPLTTALTFEFRIEVGGAASGSFADRIYLEVDVGQSPGPCGSDWRVLISPFGNSGTTCPGAPPLTVTVVGHPYLDMMAGSNRPLRFRFDTVDDADNGHTGVYVDNLRLLTSFCTPCLGLEPPLGYCIPRIESTGGTPRLGNPNYALVLSGAPETAVGAVLILGISGTTWAGGSLPWSIPGTQTVFGSCLLCVSPDVLLPVATTTTGPCATSATLALAIPNNSALTGAEAFAQWLVLDPVQAGGVLTSDAAGVVIQP